MPTKNGIYQMWIRDLKPGDDVAIRYFVGHNRDIHYKLSSVNYRDVDGSLVLINGMSFWLDGKRNDLNDHWGHHIVPITDDIYDQVMSKKKKSQIVKRLANTKWSALTMHQLTEIDKILQWVK